MKNSLQDRGHSTVVAASSPAGSGNPASQAPESSSASLLTRHPVLAVFVVALVVRAFVALFLTRYFSGTLVFDDTTYHGMAQQMASDGAGAWDPFTYNLYWSTATFMVPITALYRIFGPVMIAGQLFVGLCGAGAAACTTRVALEVMRPKPALFVGAVMAFLPSQALWSSLVMKDAAVWLVLSALALTVVLSRNASGRRLTFLLAISGVLLAGLAYLRLHTLVVASLALVLASFAGTRSVRWIRVAAAAAIALVVPWALGDIGPFGMALVLDHGSLQQRRFANAEGANTSFVEGAGVSQGDGGSSSGPGADIDPGTGGTGTDGGPGGIDEPTPKEASAGGRGVRPREPTGGAARTLQDGALQDLTHLPKGLEVMLIEPLPLPFSGSVSLRFARLESLVWYPILGLAIVGLIEMRRRLSLLLFPLLAGAGVLLTYALAEGNVGTAYRHRGEFVWVVALLAGLGVQRLLSRSSDRGDAHHPAE